MATEQEQLDILKSEVSDLKTRMAVAESNISEIKNKIDKIEGNTSKIIWLVGSAIILSLLNMVLKGGIQI